uniref:Superoxide dismutase n=1 Tax=Fibrocapsa japonica TaxID=94617 RepID=A0A7S2V2G5_9STRA|mmetsp:Transcript_4245/g.6349  ORF Transcript_4245/g.6349 Transcript_4245/m.6349 type:complete len:196 (+) Transcript_4245:173-760(+)|eukprot:CAMPEP_0113943688 /NCGR_PEP_ID=MMETSP1339-20121228/26969_1 /TAXON_ID=94617 /ORGANISM="Fibrocapsa japonica" /LENGTH=195 /DNA_ID=CAMNT_0000948627 /DNA_START=147 /DNA_END=734 /DNA_ORIENTATION=+ /assembly_acc=CAM_ASM_000762
MAIQLPPLPYEKGALAPHISEETLSFHYEKHHAGYVTKLNAALPGSEFEGKSLEEIMMNASGGMFNNAAQIWNHTFYWNSMSPNGGGEPSGPISDAINSSFGSFESFKEKFSASAGGHFGSGWAWLCKKDDGSLEIVDTHDASNPLKEGKGKPILTCDVWEHAYYIDYRNARPSYIAAWWNVINWDFANSNYTES